MKTLVLLSILVIFSMAAIAQDSAVYKRFPTVPPFSITRLPDSSLFTKKDLKKNKPVIIIIFSPGCDHCQKATEELLNNYKVFKKIQIVMASTVGYEYISKFYIENKIQNYPAIIMGRDWTNFFGYFYTIKNFPAIFVYDKKGNFIKSFESSLPVKEIEDLVD